MPGRVPPVNDPAPPWPPDGPGFFPPTPESDRPFAMALCALPHIGPARARLLRELAGSYAEAWRGPAELYARARLGAKQRSRIDRRRAALKPAELKPMLRRIGVRALFYGDPGYPAGFCAMHDPPLVVYIRGGLPLDDPAACAVVGTRRASAYGVWQAERIAGGLARAGWVVVSGLAQGIDAVAHRTAINAGGRTVAVLAGGLDQVYPPEHTPLAERGVAAGALVSEYLPGQPTVAGTFLARNRLISAISLGVVVVEAGSRSGALSTARHALEQDREVFAVPGRVGDPGSGGAHRLIRDGAALVESAADVLTGMPAWAKARVERAAGSPPAAADQGDERAPLQPWADGGGPRGKAACGEGTALEAALVARLRRGPAVEAELSSDLGRGVAQVRAALVMLELAGKIERLPGGYYKNSATGCT